MKGWPAIRINVVRYPVVVFVLCLLGLVLAARIGVLFSEKLRTAEPELREDFSVVRGATLTLNGLIIGFAFFDGLGSVRSAQEQRANGG